MFSFVANGASAAGSDAGGDDHLDELPLDDGRGGLRVERAVERDDAAERGGGIGAERTVVGVADALPHGDAARVRVLDDYASRLREALHAFEGGVGVGHVVERERLALDLRRRRHAGLGAPALDVERGALMRVLAVAHLLRLGVLEVHGAGEHGRRRIRAVPCAEVARDRAVVTRGVLERP